MLRLEGVRLGARVLTDIAGHGPALPARAPALRCLVLCGGMDDLVWLGPLAGVTRLGSLPITACSWRKRHHVRVLVDSFHQAKVRGLQLRPAQASVPCSQKAPESLAALRNVGDEVLRARLAYPSNHLLVFLLPLRPGTCAPSTTPSLRVRHAAQPRPLTLSEMPHITAFDERVRYSAHELLALRPVAGANTGCGSRLAGLPRSVLRNDAVRQAL